MALISTLFILDIEESIWFSQVVPVWIFREYWSVADMSPCRFKTCWALTGSSDGSLIRNPLETCCWRVFTFSCCWLSIATTILIVEFSVTRMFITS